MNSVQSTGSTVRKKDTISEQELTIASVEKRNWRGIFIALLVIAGVLGLIVFSIFLLSPDLEGVKTFGRKFILSEISDDTFVRRNVNNGTWISDTEIVFRDAYGGLSILNMKNKSITELMNNATFRQLDVNHYILSPDKNFVLLFRKNDEKSVLPMAQTNVDYQNFYKQETSYYVYETASQSYFLLATTSDEKASPMLQNVLWSPIVSQFSTKDSNDDTNRSFSNSLGMREQAIAFVFKNDVYYKPKVQDSVCNRITKNGFHSKILNGIPDWLYSNEKDLRGKTLAFSPNGKYLSYLSFNITHVKSYSFTANYDDTMKYPTLESIKYPKPNTPNPVVSIHVIDVRANPVSYPKTMYIPFEYSSEFYVGGMTWVSDYELTVTLTDRNQTRSIIYICKAPLFYCNEVFTENMSDNFSVLPSETPVFLHKNFTINNNLHKTNWIEQTYLLKRLLVRVDVNEFYRHVFLIPVLSSSNIKSKKQRYQITLGKYEVTEIVDYDVKNEIVYYMATKESRPGYRHLYSVKIIFNITIENNILVSATQPSCLTCFYNAHSPGFKLNNYRKKNNMKNDIFEIETVKNNYTETTLPTGKLETQEHVSAGCLYNRVQLSTHFTYFIQECLGPNIPTTFVVDTIKKERLFTLDDGKYLQNKLSPIAVPNIKKFSVVIKNGFEAQVKLYLPPMLKEDEDLAYPLIVRIDASPDSQLVSEEFVVDWNWYLASSKGIICAEIDARGSGFQGQPIRSQIKDRLGTFEIEDQLAVITYLSDTFQFIDQNKIGAYGWGYGGYTALNALAEDNSKVLQCAIAIAPIISFKFYYSYFTERYIPFDSNFNHALRESDLALKVSKLENKEFLIIQGTADQLVHQQHSLWFAKSLIQAGVTFRQQTYADEGHELSRVRYHLFKTMEAYFDEHFDIVEDSERQLKGIFGFRK
ncbi:inactive dipeptidyl peptidase 10 [Culicoides brevitarsis]|uniref:inactive dipeptidyl peptidase 10 n=1 Tax=Culicoides brevitarsis TaxID=469753 RepID=UPI00307BD6FA